MPLFRGMHVKIVGHVKTGFGLLHGNIVEVLVIQFQFLKVIIHLSEVQVQKALGSAEAQGLHRVVVAYGGDGDIRIKLVDLIDDGLIVLEILLLCLHAGKDDGRKQSGKSHNGLQGIDGVFQRLAEAQLINGIGKCILRIVHTGIHFPASQHLGRSQHGKPYIVESQLQADQVGIADPVPEHLPFLFDAFCRVVRILHKIIHHVIGDLVSVIIIFQEHAHLHRAHPGQREGIVLLDAQGVRHHHRIGSFHMAPFLAADIVRQSESGGDGVSEAGIDLISEIRIITHGGSGRCCRSGQRHNKSDGQNHRKNLL